MLRLRVFISGHQSKASFNTSSVKILYEKVGSATCNLQNVVLKNISPVDAYRNIYFTFGGHETLMCLALLFCYHSSMRWSLLLLQNQLVPGILEPHCKWAPRWGHQVAMHGFETPKVFPVKAVIWKLLPYRNLWQGAVFCLDPQSRHKGWHTCTKQKHALRKGRVNLLYEGLSYPQSKLQTSVWWCCTPPTMAVITSQSVSNKNQPGTLDLELNHIGSFEETTV